MTLELNDLVRTNVNELTEPQEYHKISRSKRVSWTTKGLRVTRLRLVSDAGFPMWDVSYCHGELEDGTPVTVLLPFSQIPKNSKGWGAKKYGWGKAFIVNMAREEKVYAKGLGLLDESVVSYLQA